MRGECFARVMPDCKAVSGFSVLTAYGVGMPDALPHCPRYGDRHVVRTGGTRVGQPAVPGVRAVVRPGPEFANRLDREQTASRPRPAQRKFGELTLQADELWSFVGHKGYSRWVWAALDADNRQVVVVMAGDRSEGTARRVWDVLPRRDRAIACTDFRSAYLAVIPRPTGTPPASKPG